MAPPTPFDFDAAWHEQDQQAEPPAIVVRGETITLPARLPARIPLFYERMAMDPAGAARDVTRADVIELLTPLVGAAKVDEWLAAGLSLDQLGGIVRKSIELYAPPQPADDEGPDDDSGKAPANTEPN